MVQWHMKSRKKTSGGIKRTDRRSTKKLAWRGGTFSATKLSEKEERISIKGRGNSQKKQLRYVVNVNITDPSTSKTSKVKILNIVENNSNRQYARRNILTKGAVIEIDLNGKKHAKVTSRPGQDGSLNAVLIEKIQTKPKKKRKTKSKEKKTEEKPIEEKKESKPEKAESKQKTEKQEEKSEENKKEETKPEKEPKAKESK